MQLKPPEVEGTFGGDTYSFPYPKHGCLFIPLDTDKSCCGDNIITAHVEVQPRPSPYFTPGKLDQISSLDGGGDTFFDVTTTGANMDGTYESFNIDADQYIFSSTVETAVYSSTSQNGIFI